MSQESPLLAHSRRASGAVTKFRFVTPGGAQVAALDTRALGVAQYDAADTTVFAVTCVGSARVEAGMVIAVGDLISSGADGRAVVAGQFCQGIALQAASAAGAIIEVLLFAPMPSSSFYSFTVATTAVVRGNFVSFAGAQQGTAGAACLGVAMFDAAIGARCVAQVNGVAQVLTGGTALTVGLAVKSNTTGAAIDQASSGVIAGYALAATAIATVGPVLLK